MDTLDPDALISIDVLIVSPSCPSLKSNGDSEDEQEQLQLVSVQFNSLDVIANQETIVELLAFFRRVSPATTESIHRRRRRRVQTRDQHCQTIESVARYGSLSSLETINAATILDTSFEAAASQEANAAAGGKKKFRNRLEITADFQRLNVLLLRAATGKMIGTALLTESKIHATVSATVSVSGSLGGLQVMNLMSGSTLHQKIVSVGKDPMIEDKRIPAAPHLELYDQQPGEEEQALTFTVLQKRQTTEGTVND